jgi:hypothetical protein
MSKSMKRYLGYMNVAGRVFHELLDSDVGEDGE